VHASVGVNASRGQKLLSTGTADAVDVGKCDLNALVARQVNTNEAVRLVNREKGVLIDVCEPAEFAAGHASGARNIPFGSVETSKDLPSNKTLPLVLVCQTGARAGRAAGMLRKAGYANVQVLAGGMKAWREANLPIEKA